MATNSIPELWDRLELWLASNAPALLPQLAPPATDDQIDALEALIGASLPDDFRASLKIHDGEAPPGRGLFLGDELLGTQRIARSWTFWTDSLDHRRFDDQSKNDITWPSDGPVRGDYWNALWIPIMSHYWGSYWCLDLNPADGGSVGQMIVVWPDNGYRGVKAASFTQWFEAFVAHCESGAFAYHENSQIILEAPQVSN